MIKSQLGTVQLTKPDYELAKKLHMIPSEVDTVVEAGLCADLTAIFNAFAIRYGLDKASKMWLDAITVYLESQKGEQNYDNNN